MKLRSIFHSLILLIGMSAVCIYPYRKEYAAAVSVLSASAPYPIVFGAPGGFEYWAGHQFVIELSLQDGTKRSITTNRKVFDSISGPHRMVMKKIVPIIFDFGPSSEGYLRMTFCGNSSAEVFNLPSGVIEGSVETILRVPQIKPTRKRGFKC